MTKIEFTFSTLLLRVRLGPLLFAHCGLVRRRRQVGHPLCIIGAPRHLSVEESPGHNTHNRSFLDKWKYPRLNYDENR